MTDVQIMAGTLTASLADRIVSGLLVPFGEECRSNLGKFSVDPGAFEIPADVTVATINEGHEREKPRGRAATLTETAAGIFASFAIAKTREGDTLLARWADPKDTDVPRKLSVEVADVVIRGGKAISGRIFGAAIVGEGAFPSATLLAAAEDVGEEPADDDPATTEEHVEETFTDEAGVTWTRVVDTTTTTEENKTTTTTTVVEETTDPESDDEEEEPVANATAPSTLTARRVKPAGSSEATDAPPQMSFSELMRAIHQVKSGQGTKTLLASIYEAGGPGADTLFAALSDIKYSGAGNLPGKAINPFPQWIGQLWDGLAYVRDVIDVMGTGTLTARTISGWKWLVKPEGGSWPGNKEPVPSNVPTAVPYSVESEYWAGAHDHANEYRHFPNPEYWESYYLAMRESYAEWSNDLALAELEAIATPLEGDVVPAGVSAGLSLLIDGAVAVVEANALPSFAFVEPALYKSILKTPHSNALEYLDAALGFDKGTLAGEGFKLRPKAGVTGVLVGAKEASTFYELGEVPIRVEAEDLVKGGLDTGLFGYAGFVAHKADAIVNVTPNVP